MTDIRNLAQRGRHGDAWRRAGISPAVRAPTSSTDSDRNLRARRWMLAGLVAFWAGVAWLLTRCS